jgi:hypothetical protein
MAKEKQPKDDLQTVAKSRMAQMPAETAGGRLDKSAPTGEARPGRSDRSEQPDMTTERETGSSKEDVPPKPMSRADKQRNQPRR